MSDIKIVLIDGSFAIRHSAETILSSAGCRLVLAEDSFDGLSKIVYCQPDVVFIDAKMPLLDGYQICSFIRKHLPDRHIQVTLLVSKNDPFDQERGSLAGTDSYLIKPFDEHSLMKAVTVHIPHPDADGDHAPIRNRLHVT